MHVLSKVQYVAEDYHPVPLPLGNPQDEVLCDKSAPYDMSNGHDRFRR